jgi:L-rhamnose mutarotase
MYIDPKTEIGGVSAVIVRDFFRATENGWGFEYLRKQLRLSRSRAETLTSELLRLGYIEEELDSPHGSRSYRETQLGRRFSLASAARPLTRKTAERKLSEFVERVRSLNANDYYLYRVHTVRVFGSYLTQRDRINDIDVAVELTPRESNHDRWWAACQARSREACEKGRRFSNMTEEMFWPQQEVLLYLKNRSRAISLHTTDDRVLMQTEFQVVFEDSAQSGDESQTVLR